MARKLAREKKTGNMSVLGESYPLSSLLGATAVYPHVRNKLEGASWFERQLEHYQPSDSKKAFKRPRGNEEQHQSDVSSPKRFISEEIVASCLQHLKLTTPPPSSAITANTTVLPSSQTSTCSPLPSSSPLFPVPHSSSLDPLTSAACSCPLSMKTVASCPRSIEMNKDEVMVCDNEANDDHRAGSILSHSNFSTVTPSGELVLDPTVVPSQSAESLTHSLENRDEVHQYVRTSSGSNKRPACVLDEEEEDEERIEEAKDQLLFSAWGPYTKRSKVDVSVTSMSDFVSCGTLPLSSLPQDRLQLTVSDEPSLCSCPDSISSDEPNAKTLPSKVSLEDGSDSNDGGQEPGPEKPLSLWISPELQAISDECGQKSLLPQAILEKLYPPNVKGMELVPWVGGPSVLAQEEESEGGQKQLFTVSNSYSSDPPIVERLVEENQRGVREIESEQRRSQYHELWTNEDGLNDDIMEP